MKQELDKSEFWPKVLQVVPTDEYGVYVYFNDGSVRLFDVKPLIRSDTVFEPLQDIAFFKTRLAVINDTVAWDIGGNRNPQKCIKSRGTVLLLFIVYSVAACSAWWRVIISSPMVWTKSVRIRNWSLGGLPPDVPLPPRRSIVPSSNKIPSTHAELAVVSES